MTTAPAFLVVGAPGGPAGDLARAFGAPPVGAAAELLDPGAGRAPDGTWPADALDALGARRWAAVVLADAIPDPGDVAVDDLDAGTWDRIAERPLRHTWTSLQAVRATGATSTVVMVTTAIGLVGAPGQVAQAAAAEGQRMLAKSAARQWTPEGIQVFGAAVHPRAFGAHRELPLTDAAPAAGTGRDLLVDLAVTVGRLLGPEMAHLSGTTLVIDGAGVMAP